MTLAFPSILVIPISLTFMSPNWLDLELSIQTLILGKWLQTRRLCPRKNSARHKPEPIDFWSLVIRRCAHLGTLSNPRSAMIPIPEVALILRGWAEDKRRLRVIARFGVADF